jgi:hypothetical protein
LTRQIHLARNVGDPYRAYHNDCRRRRCAGWQFEFAAPFATAYVPTDGTLAANTSKDGLIGPIWRVKYTIAGNYADGTTSRVNALAQVITSFHE